ncbi:MAG TPA: hypothetical protein VFP61_03060 [Acidimicrobiales bacterium]|nr:hypothetical protein [Acidimicrobiales bacterium]
MTSSVTPAGSAGSADALEAAAARAAARVADLVDELAGIAESTAAGPDDEHDAEGSTVGFERARVTALLAQARAAVAAITAAQARRRGAAAPPCERCARPIGEERLLALPATAICVECAQAAAAGNRDISATMRSNPPSARSVRSVESHKEGDV